METYDPRHAPDPAEWLKLDEGERMDLGRRYHRGIREKLPNERLHAAVHAIVETQVAMADAMPVARTLARLQIEGLDRHEAIRAIGSVVATLIHGTARDGPPQGGPTGAYHAALERLTAEGWRSGS